MRDYPLRVLVVDDSAYMRKAIREMLHQSPFIEVVDTARDASEALEKVDQIHPDVVTVDLLMPEADGVSFIRQQMARQPLPIVVVSSAEENDEMIQAAMDAGALEVVRKPTAMALDTTYRIQQGRIQAVLGAGTVSSTKLVREEAIPVQAISSLPFPLVGPRQDQQIQAVLIGISTGGPRALRVLLPGLPGNLPVPVAIVLHMPAGYTSSLAGRLNEISALEVVESAEGMEMRPGRAILAQAGVHTRLVRRADGQVVTTLSPEPRSNLYVPAVDELFTSGANTYHGRVLGVVMTGMGSDGTAGAAWIKAQGGMVFAEAEETSIVFGMPRSVIEAGLADRVVALDRIPEAIVEAVS